MKSLQSNPVDYAAMLLDLDGTLIGADRISHRVFAVVRHIAAIIPVSIASGRSSYDVLYYARQLGLTAPQISNGGATLLDPVSGASLENFWLPETRSRQIMDWVDAAAVNFIAAHPEGDITVVEDIACWNFTIISVLDLPKSTADQLVSIFEIVPDLNVVKVFQHYNGWWSVDFTGAGVNKGAAAYRLSQMLRIIPAQFIAAGDSFNDLTMLTIAGLRIVMGTAPPELKAIADFIAPAMEEDGLAVAIEALALPSRLARQI